MIFKNGNKYELQCDYCSNYVDDFDEFQDAVTHKKANGWKSININGEWTDKCPDCLEKKELIQMKINTKYENKGEVSDFSQNQDNFYDYYNYISKDKIKAKIQECREILYSFEKELELKANKEQFIHKESMNCLLGQISILQSLLEEEE